MARDSANIVKQIIVANVVLVYVVHWISSHHAAIQTIRSADQNNHEFLQTSVQRNDVSKPEVKCSCPDKSISPEPLFSNDIKRPAPTSSQPPNAIMGMARGIDIANAYRFVRSAREACPRQECDIVIFTDDSSPELNQLYETFHVKVERFLVTQFQPPKVQKFHPSSYRWILIDDYLSNLNQPYENVMFIDTRDSVFQANPFLMMNQGPGFYAFMEASSGPNIGKCGWNSGWVKDCFGQGVLQAVANKLISCSGTSMATWKAALEYTHKMKYEMLNNACERNGVDQGMHNVWVQDNRLSRIFRVSNEHGFIATVQSMKTLRRDRYGRVLNEDGVPYAVVHQYDRSDELKRQYERQYVYLRDDQLNKK